MQVSQWFYVGVQDAGAGKEMTNKAILEAFTNVANIHADKVGQGMNNRPSDLAWVVHNWYMEVYRRPLAGETVIGKTWARSYDKLQAFRDLELMTMGGETLAKATSLWVAVNPQTRRILRLTPELMEPYGPEIGQDAFPGYTFPRTWPEEQEFLDEISYKITKSMIDVNGHVHNPAYLDIVSELLPEEKEQHHYSRTEILYRKEILPQETVKAGYFMTEDNKLCAVIKSQTGDVNAIVLLYD